ncbi:uncharacterized protein LOC131224215 [Magnolia sinica]|uniref:uncharacterized protein LOC131224215 n=1 Tax=Magnolia sinica TaxID=86752 RepID=UPI0026587A96|nr:uncharacterized protein LOC131224215 [Magnolia sinica]
MDFALIIGLKTGDLHIPKIHSTKKSIREKYFKEYLILKKHLGEVFDKLVDSNKDEDVMKVGLIMCVEWFVRGTDIKIMCNMEIYDFICSLPNSTLHTISRLEGLETELILTLEPTSEELETNTIRLVRDRFQGIKDKEVEAGEENDDEQGGEGDGEGEGEGEAEEKGNGYDLAEELKEKREELKKESELSKKERKELREKEELIKEREPMQKEKETLRTEREELNERTQLKMERELFFKENEDLKKEKEELMKEMEKFVKVNKELKKENEELKKQKEEFLTERGNGDEELNKEKELKKNEELKKELKKNREEEDME